MNIQVSYYIFMHQHEKLGTICRYFSLLRWRL